MPSIEEFGKCVVDGSAPLGARMRAAFELRSAATDAAVEALETSLKDKTGTVLWRHELAFILGQIGNAKAIPTLSEILKDTSDDPIVRHEAAEALGAIGDKGSLELLAEFVKDERPEVSETCQIALQRVEWVNKQEGKEAESKEASPYESVDPAPPMDSADVAAAAEALMNTEKTLFERYRAMFTLRNNKSEEAVLALTKGLKDSSALFRHEVAYVLGQLQDPVAVMALKESLLDPKEHDMVRHEAAEALGAIGNAECVEILTKHRTDEAEIVRESCEVALDAAEYWAEGDFVAAAGSK